jgi:hypothetical protein
MFMVSSDYDLFQLTDHAISYAISHCWRIIGTAAVEKISVYILLALSHCTLHWVLNYLSIVES